MNEPVTIVGLGEILWDMLPDGKKLGGAPANFAYHASQLGHRGVIISALGADELGDEIRAIIADRGIANHLPTVAYPTGSVAIQLDERGIPQYEICEDVAWDYITWCPEMAELAENTRCVVFGSLAQRHEVSRATIQRFLSEMPESEEVLKIFDINLRQHYYSKELIESSFQLCNVLKINDDEILVIQDLFGLEDKSRDEICQYLIMSYDLRFLILTCGKLGSCIYTAESLEPVSFVPTPDTPVVDTVGAGDSFTASLASALLSGKISLAEAHEFATEVATFVCEHHGAMPTLSGELIRRLD